MPTESADGLHVCGGCIGRYARDPAGPSGGRLGPDPRNELLIQATGLIDQIEPDRHLQVEALALAMHLNHSVDDSLYLALARREAARLLTADQKLQALARQVLP